MQDILDKVAKLIDELTGEGISKENAAMVISNAAFMAASDFYKEAGQKMFRVGCCEEKPADECTDYCCGSWRLSRVASGDRIVIPKEAIEEAKRACQAYGMVIDNQDAVTVVIHGADEQSTTDGYQNQVHVFMGDWSEDIKNEAYIKVIQASPFCGEVCFSASPAFKEGDEVKWKITKEGTIVFKLA